VLYIAIGLCGSMFIIIFGAYISINSAIVIDMTYALYADAKYLPLT